MVDKCIGPNKFSYNIVIDGLFKNGMLADARTVMGLMKSSGVCPDTVYFTSRTAMAYEYLSYNVLSRRCKKHEADELAEWVPEMASEGKAVIKICGDGRVYEKLKKYSGSDWKTIGDGEARARGRERAYGGHERIDSYARYDRPQNNHEQQQLSKPLDNRQQQPVATQTYQNYSLANEDSYGRRGGYGDHEGNNRRNYQPNYKGDGEARTRGRERAYGGHERMDNYARYDRIGTIPYKFFASGNCRNEKACRFSHDDQTRNSCNNNEPNDYRQGVDSRENMAPLREASK
ncbi:hypothetical protein POM88_037621 [Heracleum sosnowskyi]|uniref:C3H1-type domain-containing protein n=1 Tax=Heracleum sosnowskyi TaxID=360622 RepID=A0AAD8HQH1_9APIA|nr:hypothetical protein POM88_037621 [Heracleum sosnowskyi]